MDWRHCGCRGVLLQGAVGDRPVLGAACAAKVGARSEAALPPATRHFVIIAPSRLPSPLFAMRWSAPPRDLGGKPGNPLSKMDVEGREWLHCHASPLALTGRPDALTIATTLDGSCRITGQLARSIERHRGAITGLINNNLGSGVKEGSDRVLDQRAEAVAKATSLSYRGPRSRPIGGSGQISTQAREYQRGQHPVAGVKLNTGKGNQAAGRSQRGRTGHGLAETAGRGQSSNRRRGAGGRGMCRSIPLGSSAPPSNTCGWRYAPPAPSPRSRGIDASSVTLTLGVQARCHASCRRKRRPPHLHLPTSKA